MLVAMTVQVPRYVDLLWPALQAVIALGGSASNEELDNAVIEREGLSSDVQGVLHGDGPSTEIEYRLAWARTHLKGMGLLTNSRRGVWSVTEKGREVTESQIRPLHAESSAENRKRNAARKSAKAASRRTDEPETNITEVDTDAGWKDVLLETVLKMSPAAFERLTQRLLREAGFSSASVTWRGGEGDIEGLGVYQLSLLSFPVFFQCKRHNGSVGAGAVRDFRGAMAGRGEKGLLITTGTFTGDARTESKRDGAPPIDLIDGDRLCDLLKEHALGVQTTTRLVEDVEVRSDYFRSLEPK
ncbi:MULTISPECIES: restriction endonuclease [Rhodococcus]|uniref:Restriction endonuclease n=1 Tax=Rhodococcus oxybenzonivorans TaxID=1990687 RepID=A0A2S2BYI6_9NOCA|nr:MULTISPECIES: restriction endonuclease [Rhodococcus]AWK73700.1 restriction endonuclease [Rhodococcus oxybenzonivorans]MDV7245749.1 restriction endonuclease [Rhodococcus oxybenzonivorans]MDV7266945.1 restriction endonuclease [Rhodococcus oxybenzonivorans]MDV7276896.1 restriction endonuclease [Rhodococcus oxybenzonivorans]MDV7336772.1 restriction endonuclease [Rhodococcus oxybenzonivorans]